MFTPVNLARKLINKIRVKMDPSIPFRNISYSQDGEDQFLSEYFCNMNTGFFVDVGAHHPFRFSNTYLLYQKGWRGINIDATPGSMDLFKKYRPEDINIEAGISNRSGKGKYYLFEEPALNGFESDVTKSHLEQGYRLREITTIPFVALKDILADQMPAENEISFFSIDIEGNELDALRSNDWNKYVPQVIMIEQQQDQLLTSLHATSVYKFLASLNYSLFYRFYRTCIYIKNNLELTS